MEKVILPKKVSEAIESLRSRGIGNKKLLNYPSLVAHATSDPAYKTICDYIYPNMDMDEETLHVYVQAVAVGYISDKSPEEKLRDFYEYHTDRKLFVGKKVIEEVVEILELKIKGINA